MRIRRIPKLLVAVNLIWLLGNALAQSSGTIKDTNDLLSRLISKGAQDRDRAFESLRQNQEFISESLCRELIDKGSNAYQGSDYSQAAFLLELAREAAILSNNRN